MGEAGSGDRREPSNGEEPEYPAREDLLYTGAGDEPEDLLYPGAPGGESADLLYPETRQDGGEELLLYPETPQAADASGTVPGADLPPGSQEARRPDTPGPSPAIQGSRDGSFAVDLPDSDWSSLEGESIAQLEMFGFCALRTDNRGDFKKCTDLRDYSPARIAAQGMGLVWIGVIEAAPGRQAQIWRAVFKGEPLDAAKLAPSTNAAALSAWARGAAEAAEELCGLVRTSGNVPSRPAPPFITLVLVIATPNDQIWRMIYPRPEAER